MNKRLSLSIALLSAALLSSCTFEWKPKSSASSQEASTYKLTIVDTLNLLYDKPEKGYAIVAPGANVKLHAKPVEGITYAMFANGQYKTAQIELEDETGPYWEYEYVMIAEDVELRFEIMVD